MDNKIRSLQEVDKTPRGHNILEEKQNLQLYKSKALSKDHPKLLIARIIFSVALTWAFWPKKNQTLKRNQVRFDGIDDEKILQIVGRNAGNNGDLKNWRRVFYDAACKPKKPLFDVVNSVVNKSVFFTKPNSFTILCLSLTKTARTFSVLSTIFSSLQKKFQKFEPRKKPNFALCQWLVRIMWYLQFQCQRSN